ncbi:MAG: hypothetical protein L0Z50_29540 [Verrucomicrobiales bacterium]|nr:hypothetical protein [Verrucomicrobiales bacterium]
MKTNRQLRNFIFALSLQVIGSVEAQVWNLAMDYSSKTNPAGAWGYGYRRAATPPSSSSIADLENTVFNLYTNVGNLSPFYPFDIPAWHASPLDGGPFLSLGKLYVTPDRIGYGAAIPGPQLLEFENTASIVRWTAPEEGDYYIKAEFLSGSEFQKDVAVLHNSRVTLLSGLFPSVRFETNYHMIAGESVEFAIVNRPWIDGYAAQGLIDATVTLITRPLVLTIQFSDVDVCWTAQTNKSYQVEYQSSLATNTWLPLGSVILGTGSRTCIVDSIREPARKFYRVKEL